MKTLRDYLEPAQDKLFNELGVFFAFSNSQFNEGKKEGVNYVQLSAGIICPKNNLSKFLKRLDDIITDGISLDIKENGENKIINRELVNQEFGVTGSIQDTASALSDYPITEKEILSVAHNYIKTHGQY